MLSAATVPTHVHLRRHARVGVAPVRKCGTRPGFSRMPVSPSAILSTTSALAALMTPGAIFGHTSMVMVPVYMLMVLSPRSQPARFLATSQVLPVAMSLLYIYLLGHAMAAGLGDTIFAIIKTMLAESFTPNMGAVADLFKSPCVTCLAWVHLLLLDFYQARAILIDGINSSVPTGHSIALCFMFGPLGLVSHCLTRLLALLLPAKGWATGQLAASRA